MNRGPAGTREFFAALPQASAARVKTVPGLQAALFVPSVSLHAAIDAAQARAPGLAIGAQNAHGEAQGAFTGEISGPMLRELGVAWVLVGHSERRQLFGESDDGVRRRAEGLLAQGFHVVACIGETRAERETAQTRLVLERQLRGLFPQGAQSPAAAFLDGRLVIAYEPVWAIGTGLTATPEQAEEAHRQVRDFLETQCGAAAAERTPILYGGSVTPENLGSLLACPNVDGGLVGGASLKPESYAALLDGGAAALNS